MEKKIYSDPHTAVIIMQQRTTLLSGSVDGSFRIIDEETEEQI